MSTGKIQRIVVRHILPLLGWAIALQLLFDGPWVPHRIDLYASLCFLLIVYGGQLIATDIKRLLQYGILWKEKATNSEDAIKASRGFATLLLIVLEILTTLWDTKVGKNGVHFSLFVRVLVLTVALPILSYTSRTLLRRQDKAVIAQKLQLK